MTTIQIKNRWTDKVLLEGESGMTMRQTLEKATQSNASLSGADLRYAYLSGADLRGADLRGANLYSANLSGAYLYSADLYSADLSGANLSGADLSGADLSGADLRDAYLSGADLRDAYLSGADLRGADLRGAKFGAERVLVGERPYFSIGPIGSRSGYLTLWLTDKGPMVIAGCFTGSLDEFAAAVEITHGDSDHGKEYGIAVLMMEAHAALWTPGVKE